jgi:hypothetical protein
VTAEERKAELIVEAYRFAHANRSPWIGLLVLWTIPDPVWDPIDERVYWAISNLDGSQRPACERRVQGRGSGELP